jgi:hypothetical protein
MFNHIATTLLALSVTVLDPAATAVAQEEPKWFVLRDHQIAACWPALLVKINGAYRHGFAQTAGGPYDSEEQALERLKILQTAGVCEP